MAKFNTAPIGTKVTNRAGGEAYQESPKLELVSLLLTSFVQDQFYRKEKQGTEDVKRLINAISDKQFVAKAAIFARNEFGMRSISHVVAGELAGSVKGAEWSKRFFDRVVRRPDDVTEILSYYRASYGKKLTHALRKGLASSLVRFDAYQLGKWRSAGSELSLVDAINLLHPKPTEALTALYRDQLRDTKGTKHKLSEAGRAETAEEADKKATMAWAEMLDKRTIGYMDLLFNLRTLLDQAPGSVDVAVEMLTDEKLIRKSLVLPFRYLTAMNEIRQLNGRGVQKVLKALSNAVDISTKNVPRFDGETLVVLDESQSMMGSQAGWNFANTKDGKAPAEIGALFAAILAKANEADLLTFSSGARYQSVNPADSTLTIANSIEFNQGGTDFRTIFETANRAYDRIIILSDMQGWVGYTAPVAEFNAYKKRTGANPKIFTFDLTGYGTLQFPQNNVFAIAGFSDKVFDLMAALDQDRNALVKRIEAVEL